MKLLAVVFLAACVTVSLTQEVKNNAPTAALTTSSPSTPASTTTTTSTSTPTPPTTSSTTLPPTTPAPTTSAPTTSAPTSTTPAPKPEEATLANYTLLRQGDNKVCAVVIVKVVATQNSTSYPFVNGTLLTGDSNCSETQATLWIESVDGYKLQIVIETDGTNFYIEQLSVEAAGVVASRGNLTQFSTPKQQYYKCAGASQVSLEEQDVKLVFSDMKYQAFRNTDTADFVGAELECNSDYHSDVVIIAIGCALALLVVVILVAYLIARRRNRQRGYQSV